MSRDRNSPEVFVDTSALVAMLDRRGAHYGRAREIEQELSDSADRLVLSDAVLIESLNYTSPRELRAASVKAVHALVDSSRVTIRPFSRAAFRRALDLYRSRLDKEWSLVDCASILACQDRGIRRVFSTDHHFVQAGFEILLP